MSQFVKKLVDTAIYQSNVKAIIKLRKTLNLSIDDICKIYDYSPDVIRHILKTKLSIETNKGEYTLPNLLKEVRKKG